MKLKNYSFKFMTTNKYDLTPLWLHESKRETRKENGDFLFYERMKPLQLEDDVNFHLGIS